MRMRLPVVRNIGGGVSEDGVVRQLRDQGTGGGRYAKQEETRNIDVGRGGGNDLEVRNGGRGEWDVKRQDGKKVGGVEGRGDGRQYEMKRGLQEGRVKRRRRRRTKKRVERERKAKRLQKIVKSGVKQGVKERKKKEGKTKDWNKEVPAGARTTGRVEDFHGSDGESEDGMIGGQNVTRVSYTLYKIMRLFGFTCVIDSPASAHSEWMKDVVRRMSFETPSFRYVGVDSNKEGLLLTRRGVGSVMDGEFVVRDVEKDLNVGEECDVLFHWPGFVGGEQDARSEGFAEHVRKVFVAAKTAGHSYVVVGQFPRLDGPTPAYRQGKWVFVGNDKVKPFLLNDHVRGVVPMASGAKAYMLYMTFYSLRAMPMDALARPEMKASSTS